MSRIAAFLVAAIETVLLGGIFLLYPRIARKGLLFGVYVGEERAAGDDAKALTRRWYRGMAALLLAGLAASAFLAAASPEPAAALVPPPLLLSLGVLCLYLLAYRQARALAPPGPPPPAVAPLASGPRTPTALASLALALGAACGLAAVAFSAFRYDALPGRVPTHFGPSGAPDAWREKSFFTVMLLPILALALGIGLGGIAWLTAHAKRALRRADEGASLEAQVRFRTAMTRFLSVTSLLVTGMLTAISFGTIRVGLGESEGLGATPMVLGGALVAWALGGTIYLAVRYGQGGSRLERAGPDNPLTDGLADNRHWWLGMFYANRDDPSILVEHRFGLGYTINFGNPKAVALLAGFLAVVFGLVIAAVLTQ